MSSQARIDANRRNAQKSTGPRTLEGKAKSSQNALRHGLAAISNHSFLVAEDRSAFDRMLLGYIRIYQPAHADKLDLLADAVFCKWRQQRVWTIEAQNIEIAIAERQYDLQKKLPKANVAAHVANAFTETAEQTQLTRHYEAQLHRQYLRNLKTLRELQATRIGLEPTLDGEEADEETAEAEPAATTPTEPIPCRRRKPPPASSSPSNRTNPSRAPSLVPRPCSFFH